MRTDSGRHGRVEAPGKAAAPPPVGEESPVRFSSQPSFGQPSTGSAASVSFIMKSMSSSSSLLTIPMDSPELGSAKKADSPALRLQERGQKRSFEAPPWASAAESVLGQPMPLAAPKSMPLPPPSTGAAVDSNPATLLQSAPALFGGTTFKRHADGDGDGGGSGRNGVRVTFGSATQETSGRPMAESIGSVGSMGSFSSEAGPPEHPIITSPIRRWLSSMEGLTWGSSQHLLRKQLRISPVNENSKYVDSEKWSFNSRSSRRSTASYGFTEHGFSASTYTTVGAPSFRGGAPPNLKLNGAWALGWQRAGRFETLKFQDPVIEERYWELKDCEKNPKFIWWWVFLNLLFVTLGACIELVSDYKSIERLAPKRVMYLMYGAMLVLELVILVLWQRFCIRHETIVIVYLCLFNLTMILASPYRVGSGYWGWDESNTYDDDEYSYVLFESERVSQNKRWRNDFKAERELDDLDDRVDLYSDDNLPTLSRALVDQAFLNGSTDSLLIQFMLLCIVGGSLAFDLRSSRSWHLPIVSIAIYATASIPPMWGPENVAYGVMNSVLMALISFASWQVGRYREYADRLSWANSQLTVTLLDRFELISPKNPEHATKTSVVIRATDTFEHAEAKRNVVIKLMRNKSQFDREINVREVLEDKYVVDVLHTSTDEHFKKLWKDSITWNLPKYTKYKYGLVMPAAQRNLMVVLMQERVDIEEARGLAVQIALCLRHMHEALMIHSDLKPLNVVRMSDGETWKLIDLDAAVPMETPVGEKLSTAHVPPETLYVYTDVNGTGERKATYRIPVAATGDEIVGGSMVRRGKLIRPAGAAYELLNADPTFDIWSFGAVLYRTLARRPLLEADDADNLRDKNEMNKLADWGKASLASAIAEADRVLAADEVDDIDRLLACDLLSWVLQREPEDRPRDCDELLQHPFFEEVRGPSFFQELTEHPGWRMPVLHIQAALGDLKAVEATLKAAEADLKAGSQVKARRATLHTSESDGDSLLLRTTSLFGTSNAMTDVEPLLGRTVLHVAAMCAQTAIVERLLAHSSVDVEAHDGAGRTALDTVKGMIDVFSDDAMKQALGDCHKLLSQAGLLNQVQRQIHSGVSVEEGADTRNFCQSLVQGRTKSYGPRVMISYATGSRDKIDGEGCGLGMQYCHLIARHLDRGGISCFSGLHVSGGQDWKVYFEKLEHADVMLAVLTPAFYTSAACLEEMAAARANNLTIIPLLFELRPDGKAPWEGGLWTDFFQELGAKGESTDDLQRLKSTCKALSKLNSEPAPPGTMVDPQMHEVLMKKLVKNTSALLAIDTLAIDRSAAVAKPLLKDVPIQEGNARTSTAAPVGLRRFASC